MCRGYFGHPQHHNSSSFAAVEGYEFLCVKETRNGKKPGAWWSCQPDISGWWTLTVRTRATTWDSNFRNKINFPDLSRSFQIIHFKISTIVHLICFQFASNSTSYQLQLRCSAPVRRWREYKCRSNRTQCRVVNEACDPGYFWMLSSWRYSLYRDL